MGFTRLLVHVNGANDILKVLDLKKDFPAMKMVLVGATEGWRVASEIRCGWRTGHWHRR